MSEHNQVGNISSSANDSSSDSSSASAMSSDVAGSGESRAQVPVSNGPREERHYWISTYPFFEASLFLSSQVTFPAQDALVSEVTHCQVYDSDGNSINEFQVLTQQGGLSVLELDQFLAACKMESGLKYAHLVVRLPHGVEDQVRIHTRLGASVVGPAVRIADRGATFFPIDVRNERSHFVALVNQSLQSAVVKLRLYLGRRSPEELVTIPPLGARLVRVETVFGDCFSAEELGGLMSSGKGDEMSQPGAAATLTEAGTPTMAAANDVAMQGYVRISSKSEGSVGIQLIERTVVRGLSGSIEGEIYTAVS